MTENFLAWFLFNDYSIFIMAGISFVAFEIIRIHKKKEKEIEEDRMAKKIAHEMLLAQKKEKDKK